LWLKEAIGIKKHAAIREPGRAVRQYHLAIITKMYFAVLWSKTQKRVSNTKG